MVFATRKQLASRLVAVIMAALPVVQDCPVLAAGRETVMPDIQFQPARQPQAVSIRQAVDIALRNFPGIAEKQFRLRAAKANVTLAKTQYLPNLNTDIQISGATENRVASVVMNNVSGFDTVPVDTGPSSFNSKLKPTVNNLQGCNLNWLMIDYGLRKANDKFAYADAQTARAAVNLTKLDVAFDAANAYLDAVATKQIIRAKTAELEHMESAGLRAQTLVAAGLRPAVDTADWNYEVAKSRIGVIKAQRDARLALVGLAEKMGTAATDIDIISFALVQPPLEAKQIGPFDLTAHPLALMKTAEVNRWGAKLNVLDKAYRPHMWLNASVWGKGSGSSVNPIKQVAGGTLPQVFNYMIGVSYSFPIMEYFPLKAQKEMARSNQMAARADFELAMQILEKKDARARILLAQSKKVAEQTPILVEAAKVRELKVLKRYSTGLTNMVSLADAEKALAEAEVEDALAQLEVWRSILSLAYAQGSLTPFLQLVDIVESNTKRN